MFEHSKRYRGIDISPEQWWAAQEFVPEETVVCDDYLAVDIENVDVFVFLYSFFYFTEIKQKQVLKKCYNELNDTGSVVLLVRNEINPVCYVEEWCGNPMIWSHTGVSYVLRIGREIGFSAGCCLAEFNPKYSWVFLSKGG